MQPRDMICTRDWKACPNTTKYVTAILTLPILLSRPKAHRISLTGHTQRRATLPQMQHGRICCSVWREIPKGQRNTWICSAKRATRQNNTCKNGCPLSPHRSPSRAMKKNVHSCSHGWMLSTTNKQWLAAFLSEPMPTI